MELPKLPPEQKSETDLMQWMRFLNGKRREDFEKMAKKNSCFEEAYKELDKLSADEKKRLEYEARQKAIRDRDILIKTGENRGRKEIILSMIEAGLPLEQIAEITKETLETIQELKKRWDDGKRAAIIVVLSFCQNIEFYYYSVVQSFGIKK